MFPTRAPANDNGIEGIALNYGWHAKYEVRNGFAIGIDGFGVVDNFGQFAGAEQSTA